MKTCNSCSTSKAVTEFVKNRSTKDGLQAYCKPCNRAYYQTNKVTIAKRASKYYQTNKAQIAENLQSGTCGDCGQACSLRSDHCRECFRTSATISYGAAHHRVRALHGLASNYQCVDCNGEAREWTYAHTDPDELSELNSSGSTLVYSCDPGHYEPRCKPCHAAFDKFF